MFVNGTDEDFRRRQVTQEDINGLHLHQDLLGTPNKKKIIGHFPEGGLNNKIFRTNKDLKDFGND